MNQTEKQVRGVIARACESLMNHVVDPHAHVPTLTEVMRQTADLVDAEMRDHACARRLTTRGYQRFNVGCAN